MTVVANGPIANEVAMKATILLATLKQSGLSNTQTLCEFLADRMRRSGITPEIVKLVDRNIPPGTSSNMGEGDDWPAILDTLLASDMLIFATPIWWNSHSSLMQRAVERLDALHDKVMNGEPSGLDGKAGGIVITGDSDGAQSVIGGLCNFLNGIGVVVPAYATLSVLWEQQAKGKTPARGELLAKYEQDYAKTADRMIEQLKRFAG